MFLYYFHRKRIDSYTFCLFIEGCFYINVDFSKDYYGVIVRTRRSWWNKKVFPRVLVSILKISSGNYIHAKQIEEIRDISQNYFSLNPIIKYHGKG